SKFRNNRTGSRRSPDRILHPMGWYNIPRSGTAPPVCAESAILKIRTVRCNTFPDGYCPSSACRAEWPDRLARQWNEAWHNLRPLPPHKLPTAHPDIPLQSVDNCAHVHPVPDPASPLPPQMHLPENESSPRWSRGWYRPKRATDAGTQSML